MATVVPPPSKRQKVANAERARVQQLPEHIPEGSMRMVIIDHATNEPIGPAVVVSRSQASTKNLEILTNSLKGVENVSDRIPYRFFYRYKKEGKQHEIALGDNVNIYTSLLKQKWWDSGEDELQMLSRPEDVFKVRAVTRCSSTISGHGGGVLAAQFSPASGSRFVTGSADNSARIWDCDTGTPLKTLQGHSGTVLCVAFAPDDSILATGSQDKTIRLWDAKTGKPLGGPLKGHTAFIRSLSWEPYHLQQQGRPRLASSSKDCTVRVWDTVGRKTDFTLSGHTGSVARVKWGGTGLIYTCSHDQTIKVWDSKEGRLIHDLKSHSHWVNSLALSTDFVLRTAFHDHTGQIPATVDEKVKKAKERFEKAATVDAKIVERLASASDDAVIYLWDPMGHSPTKPIGRMNGHLKTVNHVTFSPDGLYIASSSFDNSIRLWDAKDGQYIRTFKGHVAPVYLTAFSPDSRLLVSASKDTTLKCWDVKTGKISTDLPGHKDEVWAVDWSPDGHKVGSGGKDKAVKIWSH